MFKQTMPAISKEFFEHLQDAFRRNEVEPETVRDRIMYEAGQQAMLRYIERHIRTQTIVISDKRKLRSGGKDATEKRL